MIDSSSIDASGQLDAQTKARIADVQSQAGQAGINADTQAGMVAAVKGQALTTQQIQGGFITAAVTGAAALGASVPVAGPIIAAMAVAVFGGGMAIMDGIKSFLASQGMYDHTPVKCSGEDPTQYAKSPSDPNWITYNSMCGGWQPFTTGSFENWARPIMMLATEMAANCVPIPGVQTFGQYARAVVATWNAASPGAPMRTITWYLDTPQSQGLDPSKASAYECDPIQALIRDTYYDISQTDRSQATYTPHPWSIQVADPTAIAVGGPSTSKATSIAKHTVVIAAGGAVGGIVYAYATGKAIDAVFENAWKILSGWFASGVGSVEKAAGVAKEKIVRRR